MSDQCEACGLILSRPEDYPNSDTSKNYCRWCARPDGSLRPFNEIFEMTWRFVQKTQGLPEPIAKQAAWGFLCEQPAWKDYPLNRADYVPLNEDDAQSS